MKKEMCILKNVSIEEITGNSIKVLSRSRGAFEFNKFSKGSKGELAKIKKKAQNCMSSNGKPLKVNIIYRGSFGQEDFDAEVRSIEY